MSDRIISRPASEAYRESWERIWGKKPPRWRLEMTDYEGVRHYVTDDISGLGAFRSGCGCLGASHACELCLPPNSEVGEAN
jgi:hypothetical protein